MIDVVSERRVFGAQCFLCRPVWLNFLQFELELGPFDPQSHDCRANDGDGWHAFAEKKEAIGTA